MSSQYKIKRIRIRGFRRLHDINLEMKSSSPMVLIGANGIGKTSLLDALSLLSSSASGMLTSALSQLGGLTSVLTRGKTDTLSFFIDMEVPNYKPLEYKLCVEQKGHTHSIYEEVLSQARDESGIPFKHINSHNGNIQYFDTETHRLIRPDWELNPLETALSQVPKMYQQPEELRRILSSATKYHVLDVGSRAPVKLPQPMKPANFPGADGEDIIPFLYYLRESDRDRYEMIEDTLRVAFPSFESLSFPPSAMGMLSMSWKDQNYTKPFAPQELSEGTLRFLWLISLLQSPELSTITMIDEPEVSLHPELLSILADLMREASQRTQLVVSTHSDRFIRFLEPGEVVVMDSDEEGCATAKWGDSLDLDEWLKEYSLDEVWRLGRMGGRS